MSQHTQTTIKAAQYIVFVRVVDYTHVIFLHFVLRMFGMKEYEYLELVVELILLGIG